MSIKILSHRLIISFLLVIMLFSIFSFQKAYSQPDKLKSLRDSVDKYYYSFDLYGLKNTLNNIEQYQKNNKNSYYALYYSGIVRYCIGRVVYNANRDLAYDYFDSSLDRFEKAYQIEKNPIALAMISAAYGKKAALSPLKSLFFGQKAKNKIFESYEEDKNNSKILLVAATHLMHIPAIYGGDKEKARLMLKKCLALNSSTQTADKYELNWADDAEIYAYLAQIDILEGKIADARSNMKKALELRANYGFVLIDLENQIKEKQK